MIIARRNILCGIAATIGAHTALLGKAFQGVPQFPPLEPEPHDGRPSDRFPERDPRLRPDPKKLLAENQKNLRRDANNLLQLAQELKMEADKTDQTDVLSLSLIHKAEEVEKLAKQIRSLARSA
jgi:hypothetical protein